MDAVRNAVANGVRLTQNASALGFNPNASGLGLADNAIAFGIDPNTPGLEQNTPGLAHDPITPGFFLETTFYKVKLNGSMERML